ncbi:hypothetical protein FRC06_005372 [Ceratobasidium sp. 370]|nr:hypothetical protein FRC06_005372 [Ceratobasidium sp. 370]
MIFTIYSSLVLLGAVSGVSAHAASPLAVAVAVEQFKNAKITPDLFSGFNPTGLLSVNYTETVGRPLTVGQEVPRSNVTTNVPVLLIRGTAEAEATAGGPFNVTNILYTVLCVDANTAGSSNPNGHYLHYLANNLAYGENHDHTVTLKSTGAPVVAYVPPNPPSGSGPHRYTWLAYAQSSNFSAPSTPAPGSGIGLFNLTQYISAARFGSPLAGTYFTVQEGPANASVAATTAVDSTTLPQYTPTSASGSAGASATSKPNGAIKGADWAPGVMALMGAAGVFFSL